jgi:hypothetical protein
VIFISQFLIHHHFFLKDQSLMDQNKSENLKDKLFKIIRKNKEEKKSLAKILKELNKKNKQE